MSGRKYRAYTGVGSRETPEPALALIERVAKKLAADRWTLRSGHAPGADQAFERGAAHRAEIYLPWPDFESDVAELRGTYGRVPSPAVV